MKTLLAAALLLAVRGATSAQTRPLELLPGDDWMHAARPGLRVAVARPLAGMDPIENWIEANFRLVAATHGRLRLRSLHAAALRSNEMHGALHWRGPWFELDAAAAVARLEIETLGAVLHRSAACALVFVHGPTRFGSRLEFPTAAQWGTPIWRHTLHVRGETFSFGLQRRASRYALREIWSAAASLQLHERFALSVQRRDEEILAQLHARASRLGLALSLPLTSPHGGGAAVGLAWYP